MYNISVKTLKRELEGFPVEVTITNSKGTERGMLHFDDVIVEPHKPISIIFLNHGNDDYLVEYCRKNDIYKRVLNRRTGMCVYIVYHTFGYNAQDYICYTIQKYKKYTKQSKNKKLY